MPTPTPSSPAYPVGILATPSPSSPASPLDDMPTPTPGSPAYPVGILATPSPSSPASPLDEMPTPTPSSPASPVGILDTPSPSSPASPLDEMPTPTPSSPASPLGTNATLSPPLLPAGFGTKSAFYAFDDSAAGLRVRIYDPSIPGEKETNNYSGTGQQIAQGLADEINGVGGFEQMTNDGEPLTASVADNVLTISGNITGELPERFIVFNFLGVQKGASSFFMGTTFSTPLPSAPTAPTGITINPTPSYVSQVSDFPLLPIGDNLQGELDTSLTSNWVVNGFTVSSNGTELFIDDSNDGATSFAQTNDNGIVSDGDYLWFAKFEMPGVSTGNSLMLALGRSGDAEGVFITGGFSWETGAAYSGISMGARSANGAVGVSGPQISSQELEAEHEIAVHFNSINNSYSLYYKVAGTWEYQGAASAFPCYSPVIRVYAARRGSIHIKHSFFARPNFVAIGDSICAGHNFFDPDPDFYLGNDNWRNSWQYYYQPTLDQNGQPLRNNIVVNYGIGAQDSEEINERVDAMLTATEPQVVFLHVSSNDFGAGFDQSERKAWTQSSVDKIRAASATVHLLSPVFHNANTASSDSYRLFWSARFDITGVKNYISWNEALFTAGTETIPSSLLENDAFHPNLAGYALMGGFVADQMQA